MNMNKRLPLILIAVLTASLSTSAVAMTEHQANAQLDRIASSNESRQEARETLNTLIAHGVPVDQALAVVSSAVEHHYTASEIRQLGTGLRALLQDKVPAKYAVDTARRAIDANYSAADTFSTLNKFDRQVRQGVPAARAHAEINSAMTRNKAPEGAVNEHAMDKQAPPTGFGSGTGMGAGGEAGGVGAGTGGNPMGSGGGMGAGGAAPAGSGMGSGTGMGGMQR